MYFDHDEDERDPFEAFGEAETTNAEIAQEEFEAAAQ